MQLVASDLDGTLVRPDGSISERTLRVLRRCENRSVDVLFVTGRPPRWLAPVAHACGHHGLVVCANGAAVYDLQNERLRSVRALTEQAVLEVADRLHEVMPGAVFAVETTAGHRRQPGREGGPTGDRSSLPALLDGTPVLKLLCRVPEGSADELLALARVELAGLAEPVHSNPRDNLIEIAAPGVSKASTLAVVAAERGVPPAEVVAFGDMPNDVPMLRWAGVGYAMADGHPEAIAAADRTAPPCAQDGVAQVLERLLAEA